jgi:hypothetical protein
MAMTTDWTASGQQNGQCQISPVFNPCNGSGRFTPDFAYVSGLPSGSNNNAGTPEKFLSNSNDPNLGYAGDVRFLGGTCCFKTFETAYNTGGELFFIQNPQERSLIRLVPQVDTSYSLQSGIKIDGAPITDVLTTSSVTSSTQVTNREQHMSILPHSTEFEYMDLACAGPGGSGVSYTAEPMAALSYTATVDKVLKFIPDSLGEVCHYGWNQGFVYKPALSKAAGADAKCEFQFTFHYHVNVEKQGNSGTNSWAVPSDTALRSPGVSDPRAAAAMQTVIDGVKVARANDPVVAFKGGQDSLSSHLPKILGQVARAAPDIASGIASALGPGLPRTILEGVATAGRAIFG